MNRTALGVVALAVGAILILGLYNIYKPQTNSMVRDTFSKIHMTNMAKDGHYAGLDYTDDGHGHIEFTKGTITNNLTSGWSWSHGLVKGNAPGDIKNATSIKFDNVKVSTNKLSGMFDYDSHLQSIDLGNNFDTTSCRSWTNSMFDHDPNLHHINLGNKFNTNLSGLNAMFLGDHQLHWSDITGHTTNEMKSQFENQRIYN